MNVQIEHERSFIAGCWQSQTGKHNLNMIEFQLRWRTLIKTTDAHDINVALARMFYVIDESLQDAIFIADQDIDAAKMLMMLGFKVALVPQEATDQIIGMAIFCKLQAVTQDRMMLQSLDIRSPMVQNVWFLHSHTETLGPLEQQGWWHQSDADCCGITDHEQTPMIMPDVWRSEDLTWTDTTVQPAQVLYADFRRNEKQ
jgi:hypothetical protein